jgi:hypothetical protein
MANINNTTDIKCKIDIQTQIPVVDEKYFESSSLYEKCKCIDKIKSSLEIFVKITLLNIMPTWIFIKTNTIKTSVLMYLRIT